MRSMARLNHVPFGQGVNSRFHCDLRTTGPSRPDGRNLPGPGQVVKAEHPALMPILLAGGDREADEMPLSPGRKVDLPRLGDPEGWSG